MLKIPDDLKEADIGADDAGHEADDEDESVFQRAEEELCFSVRVPVHCSIDLRKEKLKRNSNRYCLFHCPLSIRNLNCPKLRW